VERRVWDAVSTRFAAHLLLPPRHWLAASIIDLIAVVESVLNHDHDDGEYELWNLLPGSRQ
jgi:hypothetical protein